MPSGKRCLVIAKRFGYVGAIVFKLNLIMSDFSAIKLTEYSHGAGCGCKISPQVLDTILASKLDLKTDPRLLVGHSSKDDAAAFEAWTRSESFRAAHANAGQQRDLYLGPPQFEGFDVVL